MERVLKNILYHILMMAGIVIVLVGGAALAYKASKPVELRESEDGFYEIYTAYDYERFWQKVTHNMPFICGRLMADIYLNDVEKYDNWEQDALTGRGREVTIFSGEFDGNGYTVYGLYSENGYGLVEENKGTIRDVAIQSSLITGEKDLGGICLYNDGIISNCEFGGELKSLTPEPDAYSRMAGISLENEGIIEGCGYRGKMTACQRSSHRRKAGISVSNRGEIVNCYNFTRENIDKENDFFYTIANRGEKCCFVREDVRWKTFYNGQIMSLEGIWELYLPAFLDKDLSAIYLGAQNPLTCFAQAEQMRDLPAAVSQTQLAIYRGCKDDAGLFGKEKGILNESTQGGVCRKMLEDIGMDERQNALRKALLDTNVCGLIWSVLVYKGINWESIVLEGVSEAEKESPLFEIEIYDKYHREQHVRLAGYRMESDGKKDYSAIRDLCADILREEDREGESGLFYTTGEMLYQIGMQETADESEEKENSLVTDKTQFCNKIWEVMAREIREGKSASYVY